MTVVTDYYRSLLEIEHQKGIWGVISIQKAPHIAKMMKQYQLNEILDYGAGAGNLAKTLVEIMPEAIVHQYEPGRPELSNSPSPCDMVACIDVIEHVEPDCLEAVLNDLERVIQRYAFINISTRKASRVLSNGWNAHICLKDPNEWHDIFANRFDIINMNLYNHSVELELAKKGTHYANRV